jgi:hypothetical protein
LLKVALNTINPNPENFKTLQWHQFWRSQHALPLISVRPDWLALIVAIMSVSILTTVIILYLKMSRDGGSSLRLDKYR